MENPGNIAQAEQRGKVISGQGALKKLTFSLSKLTIYERQRIEKAKAYALEQATKALLFKQQLAQVQKQSQDDTQLRHRQQALTMMCRIYIGSINFVIKEEDVRKAFLPFGPIKNITMPFDTAEQHHKGYAFMEYETPEAASLAIKRLHSTTISGYIIKVGRPSNMPAMQSFVDQVMSEAIHHGIIYVAGIPQMIDEDNLSEVFKNFGNIKSCRFLTDPMMPGKHKGCGYITYENVEQADLAIQGDGLNMGGHFLKVCRAVTPPTPIAAPTPSMPMASAIAAASISAKIQQLEALGVNHP